MTTLRTRRGGAHEARRRLAKAREFLAVAEVSQSGGLNSAATNAAVISGIAAADAICCTRLGVFSRAQDHREAVRLLKEAEPDCVQRFQRLLAWKHDSAYGMGDLSAQDTSSALRHARALVERADAVVADRFGSGP